jgi:hypothetical protein
MKYILLLLVLVLAGCGPAEYKEQHFSQMPPELKDCKTYYITEGNGGGITVMRCPEATTSVNKQEGKVKKTYVVIDGKAYEKGE